jgi:hypothetical protein
MAILSVMAAAAFGSARSAIATKAKTASAGMPAVYDQAKALACSVGPPGTDEIKYDSGYDIGNEWCFYDRRSRYAVRMDPAYHPAIVAQCDVLLRSPLNHDSIYVEVWFDRNGDSLPDFPPVWGGWGQASEDTLTWPDTITVRPPLGSVVCLTGSFWVSMMQDTLDSYAVYHPVADDTVCCYPDHQYYYYPPDGIWSHGPEYDCDAMIRSWTYAPLPGQIMCMAILAPSGEIGEGDSVVPRVMLFNGGSVDSAWVWFRIRHADSTDGYVDSDFVHILPSHSDTASFRLWVAGPPGLYPMQCTSDSNDTVWPETIMVLPGGGLEDGRLPQSLARNGIEVGPNPIRSQAAIRYSVLGKSRVLLRILDARGTVVRTLVSGCSAPGEHLAVWDTRDDQGRPAARGIYFVRLESQDGQETRKVILAR